MFVGEKHLAKKKEDEKVNLKESKKGEILKRVFP